MRDKLDSEISELVAKLREIQRLLPAQAEPTPSVRIWGEILLGMVGGIDEAAAQLRQELLSEPGAARQHAFDQAVQSELDRALGIDSSPPVERPQNPFDKGEEGCRDDPTRDTGDEGGAAIGAGVRGPSPRRGPGAARSFEESDEPPRNP